MPLAAMTNPLIVNLSGSLLVDRAAQLKKELGEAVAASERVLVSLSLVEELDLACLQVLYAARRAAAAAGRELRFVGSVPSRIVERLYVTGFLKGKPERAEDFEAMLQDF